jgi:hypothetical protein
MLTGEAGTVAPRNARSGTLATPPLVTARGQCYEARP